MSTSPTPSNTAPTKPDETQTTPNDNPDGECSMCYEPYSPDHPAVALPNCVHVVGLQCIEEWISSNNAQRNNCPECRAVIEHDGDAEGVPLRAYHDDGFHDPAVPYNAVLVPVAMPAPVPAPANSAFDISIVLQADQYQPVQQLVAPAPRVQHPLPFLDPHQQQVLSGPAPRVPQVVYDPAPPMLQPIVVTAPGAPNVQQRRRGLGSRIANFFRPYDPLYSSSRSSRTRESRPHRQTSSFSARTRPSTSTTVGVAGGSRWESHLVEFERSVGPRGGSAYSFSLGTARWERFN